MVGADGVEPMGSEELEASGSPLWVEKPEDFSSAALLSQALGKELNWK